MCLKVLQLDPLLVKKNPPAFENPQLKINKDPQFKTDSTKMRKRPAATALPGRLPHGCLHPSHRSWWSSTPTQSPGPSLVSARHSRLPLNSLAPPKNSLPFSHLREEAPEPTSRRAGTHRGSGGGRSPRLRGGGASSSSCFAGEN